MNERTHASRRITQFSPVRQLACTLAIGCTLIIVPLLGAQTCVGLPAPDAGRVQLGAGYASRPETDQYALSAGGVSASLFGQLATTTSNYDGTTDFALQGSANLGLRVPLSTGRLLELCPIVSGALGGIFRHPEDRPPSEPSRRAERIASTREARAGLALGYRVKVGRRFTVIPSLSANVAHASLRQPNTGFSISDTYGLMGVSVGLVMGPRFTAHPYVWLPVGLEGAPRTVGLAYTVSLWPRRTSI